MMMMMAWNLHMWILLLLELAHFISLGASVNLMMAMSKNFVQIEGCWSLANIFLRQCVLHVGLVRREWLWLYLGASMFGENCIASFGLKMKLL